MTSGNCTNKYVVLVLLMPKSNQTKKIFDPKIVHRKSVKVIFYKYSENSFLTGGLFMQKIYILTLRRLKNCKFLSNIEQYSENKFSTKLRIPTLSSEQHTRG